MIVEIVVMPPKPLNKHYQTLLHITTHITIFESLLLARVLDHQVLFKVHLQDSAWKEVVYVLPITSILRRMLVSGSCFSNSSHSYNLDLASSDSRNGALDDCSMYFVNSWVIQ